MQTDNFSSWRDRTVIDENRIDIMRVMEPYKLIPVIVQCGDHKNKPVVDAM